MAEPVVKWAGGKRQLLDTILARAPRRYRHYFEPFLGVARCFLGCNRHG
ncbi:DNA adenine methylase [Mobiluncus mulieris]|nr:DNA adenine methylase [Mobiluncus mulieris]